MTTKKKRQTNQKWNVRVDHEALVPEITSLLPEGKSVLLTELTVEEETEAASKREKAEDSQLVAECREAGWKTTIHPVEVGCRGVVDHTPLEGR